MKKNPILFVSMLLVGLVACTSDYDNGITAPAKVIELNASTSAKTRVSMELDESAQSIDLGWEMGDAFEVYASDGSYVGVFNYSGTEGASNGTFTSTEDVAMSSGASYTAYFPTKGAVLGLTSQYSSQETNNTVGHLNNCVIMSANFTYNTSGTSFAFSHEVAILGFEFAIEATPAKLVYSDGIGGTYTVNYSGGTSTDGNYNIYVAINPTTNESRNITLTVYDDDSSEYEFSKTVTAAHEAGVFYTPTISLTKLEIASWQVGDLVYNRLGVADGIIVWVNETDDTQAMALSLEIYDGYWDSNAPDAQDVALDDDVYRAIGAGDDCYDIISSYAAYGDSYEIFVWAQSLGDDWYIPTVYDLRDRIVPAFQVTEGSWDGALGTGLDKMLTDAGGISISGDLDLTGTANCIRYWSCNTTSTGAKARAFRLYDSNFSWSTFSFNNSAPYARAVKYIRM